MISDIKIQQKVSEKLTEMNTSTDRLKEGRNKVLSFLFINRSCPILISFLSASKLTPKNLINIYNSLWPVWPDKNRQMSL